MEVFRTVGLDLMFSDIKSTLADFRTHFDVFFNEKGLHDRGELDAAVERLTNRATSSSPTARSGCAPPTSATTRTGSSRTRKGGWTYFAADCAYYLDKRERGFDKLVLMLGADHHGYVGRMQAISQAFGDEPGTLEILIGQFVNLCATASPSGCRSGPAT